MTDEQFMIHIICEICDYATQNNMEPDETIEILCNNILAMLEISTFNGWKGSEYNDYCQ